MTNDQTHVIVGASLTGAKAAETLREEGFDGRIVLLGAEPASVDERRLADPDVALDHFTSPARGSVA